jgi:purine-nucleoside phosphorylase
MPGELLVLGAFAPELEPLRQALGGQPQVRFAEVGIGLSTAAARAAEFLLQHRPAQVLFVGSVGTIDSQVPLLRLIAARAVALADLSLVNHSSYVPDTYTTEYESDTEALQTLSENASVPLLIAKCYSPLSISSTVEVGRTLGRATQAHFESLELFGIAAACAAQNVPWNAVCAVTNYVGPEGHQQWQTNHQQAAEATAQGLSSCISKLLPQDTAQNGHHPMISAM